MAPVSAEGSSGSLRRWSPRVAIFAALLSATVALGACGGGDDTSSTESGTPASGTGDVTTGGTLTFARSLDAEAGLNPINAPNNGSIFTIQQIFDQLVEVQGSEIVPGLAESWEHSSDGLEWTFHLRDAQFSNGDPVTADDVDFSIERFADPKINVNYATLGSAIEKVDAVDDHTVKITLNDVDGAFLDNIAMFAAAIVPQKVVEDVGDKAFAEDPIGSGPFMVKEFKRGQRTVLVRNPHYWREGQPYLDEVDFEFVPDANTRTLELRSGEVDVADGIPYNQVDSLDASDGVTVEVADSLKWDAIFLNTKEPPLDEVEVRQALAYATPKDQILDAVLFGNAQVANSQIPRVKYWDESIEPYQYDIDQATGAAVQVERARRFRPGAADPVRRRGREADRRDHQAGVGEDRGQRHDRSARLRDHVLRLALRQGRRGGHLPRGRALERHPVRRRDRGAHVRPEGRAELARYVLRQPEGHPAARRRQGNARRGPARPGLLARFSRSDRTMSRRCRCSSPSRSPAIKTP